MPAKLDPGNPRFRKLGSQGVPTRAQAGRVALALCGQGAQAGAQHDRNRETQGAKAGWDQVAMRAAGGQGWG